MFKIELQGLDGLHVRAYVGKIIRNLFLFGGVETEGRNEQWCHNLQLKHKSMVTPQSRDVLQLYYLVLYMYICASLGSDGKESTSKTGDQNSIPGLGRSPEGGHGNPLQYSCLENPMYPGAWQAIIHGVTKNQTQLKWLTHTHVYMY